MAAWISFQNENHSRRGKISKGNQKGNRVWNDISSRAKRARIVDLDNGKPIMVN